MTSDHHPANSNTPYFVASSWAPWSSVRPYVAAWAAVACAGYSNWLMLHQATLEAGSALMRFPGLADGDAGSLGAIALSAVAEDIRDCGEAVMQAQADALEALRHSA